jgi:hypothetical protein
MDPNLVAQLLANDPNTTNTQPTGPSLQQPSNNALQPQNNPPLQSPPPAPASPTPSTTNQLSPPRQDKYDNIYNPNQSGPRYYSDDSESDSDSDNHSPFSFPGISINSNNGNNYGNVINSSNFSPMNTGIMTGWPNGNTVFINGQDWSGVPQSQWPASVRRDYQRGMAAGARGMAEGARAMGEAADLMNSMGLGMGMMGIGMGMGMGMGGGRRRR